MFTNVCSLYDRGTLVIFLTQRSAYEVRMSLVGSKIGIRDRGSTGHNPPVEPLVLPTVVHEVGGQPMEKLGVAGTVRYINLTLPTNSMSLIRVAAA